MRLEEIVRVSREVAGERSRLAKRERLVACLRALASRATADEQRFLARWLAGGLRQGASEGAMLDALAAAAGSASTRSPRWCPRRSG